MTRFLIPGDLSGNINAICIKYFFLYAEGSPNLNQRRKIAGFLTGQGNFYADRIPHEPFPAIKKIPGYLNKGEPQGKV
jgi:hypothetical protein